MVADQKAQELKAAQDKKLAEEKAIADLKAAQAPKPQPGAQQ
jgi:hypothetical protein